MKAAEIARALMCGRSGCPCARWKPGGAVHCPAHDDGKPSLSVSVADNGNALVNCLACWRAFLRTMVLILNFMLLPMSQWDG